MTCGLCVYDCLNYVFCLPCCGKVCLNGNKLSVIKWLVALILAVITHISVEAKNDELSYAFGMVMRTSGRSNFGVYMILFSLQAIIFPVLHVLAICIIGACTCCFEFWDEDVSEEHNYTSEWWSFGYVAYETG